MRALLMAAALLAACSAPTSAGAQAQGDLAGTWAFQTQSYGGEAMGAVMSGAAVMTASAPNRYEIRLLSNELVVNRATGQSRLLTARQTCTGEMDGAQFSIACQMAEPLEGYQPDNFVLQRGDNPDQLVGALSSASSATVTFTRMR